jgi:hypothetical protein
MSLGASERARARSLERMKNNNISKRPKMFRYILASSVDSDVTKASKKRKIRADVLFFS